eukprot:CAMPEP_0114414166 /NCGR_PEP_ID=MMETSP0103-20121206/1243_1 /TAXON_ID=37642 ORGANISM="Paraphysomonas imperforata, Strain PA2" /NCGR_SAMPLE_ID=MMETSP0103 /ASSEMBLY_ACC=CAM_ASM_000201 /LENGTH=125 /DNA_ID=CAMNT_0001582289 /DNA_START=137 /DNA_END=514 /DNA_ORIENTATION=+
MGAAASVEMNKPADASDIASANSLDIARDEVIRLRGALGHFARQAGFNEVVYDASDLVLGEDSDKDFKRCVDEVIFIRSALRLSTQKATRSRRALMTNIEEKKWDAKDDEDYASDDDSSTGSDSN